MTRAVVSTLRYPVAGEERERPLLALWILVLAGFVVPLVPLVPVVGYLIRVLDASDRGAPAPALFEDAWTLLRRGVGGTGLAVGFLAGPFLALLVTVYGAMFGAGAFAAGGPSTLLVAAGSVVVLLFAVLGGYLLPIALFRYGRTGSLRAAVEARWLRGAATHGAYFAGWILGAAVAAAGAGLARALLSVPRVGPVLAALVLAHVAVVTCHLWGRALARVH